MHIAEHEHMCSFLAHTQTETNEEMLIFSTSKEENKSSTVVGYTISSGKKK